MEHLEIKFKKLVASSEEKILKKINQLDEKVTNNFKEMMGKLEDVKKDQKTLVTEVNASLAQTYSGIDHSLKGFSQEITKNYNEYRGFKMQMTNKLARIGNVWSEEMETETKQTCEAEFATSVSKRPTSTPKEPKSKGEKQPKKSGYKRLYPSFDTALPDLEKKIQEYCKTAEDTNLRKFTQVFRAWKQEGVRIPEDEEKDEHLMSAHQRMRNIMRKKRNIEKNKVDSQLEGNGKVQE